MHIALFFWDRLPVPEYGGTQRIVVYLARGLAEAGHRVTLVAGHGSAVPEATLVPVDLAQARSPGRSTSGRSFPGAWICCSPASAAASRRRCPGFAGSPATGSRAPSARRTPSILSENHARRHGGHAWVYNGIDPARLPVPPRQGRLRSLHRPAARRQGLSLGDRRRQAHPPPAAAGRRLAAEPEPVGAGTSGRWGESGRRSCSRGRRRSGCRRSGTSPSASR